MFTGIRRRIIISNLIGLPLFFIALLVINSTRSSLTDVHIRLMTEQAEIIASMLTLYPSEEYNENQDILRPIARGHGFYLRPPLLPHDMDALLFDIEGNILEDSKKNLLGRITELPLPDIGEKKIYQSRWQILSYKIMKLFYDSSVTNVIIFDKNDGAKGQDFIEFHKAVTGNNASAIRIDQKNQTILSVAVPVKRLGKVLGVLKISSSNQKITKAISKERQTLIILFLIAFLTTFSTSFLLARNIAHPIKKLVGLISLAEKSNFHSNFLKKIDLSEFNDRNDEIGQLSQSFENMMKKLLYHFSDLESFAADVAHELKNPLTSIKSAIDLFHRIDTPEKKIKLLDVIKHDIKRIERLIGDISNLSRIDAEMNREDTERIDVVQMLYDLIEHYKQGALSENINFIFQSSHKQLFITAIAERLGRALSNIIENALSFTPKGGSIEINLENVKEKLSITITDTGPGISEKSLAKIFDRFYSDRPHASKFGNNSGLGLAIVKRIIQSHGGQIHASNRKDGVLGAVFTITLPV